jgi:hypothetical protein
MAVIIRVQDGANRNAVGKYGFFIINSNATKTFRIRTDAAANLIRKKGE